MARPPQPELARSAKTDLDPEHVDTGLPGQPPPSGGEAGPVPVDNQPGHHPAKEQDKPDLDAFAAKLGTAPRARSATRAGKPPDPEVAKAGAASRPAPTPERGPAPPPKIQATPANRPAAAPGGPESAPAAGMSGPQPLPDEGPEPRVVSLVLLPLRETVKRLEELERTLTERLTGGVLSARGGRGPRGR